MLRSAAVVFMCVGAEECCCGVHVCVCLGVLLWCSCVWVLWSAAVVFMCVGAEECCCGVHVCGC